MSAASLAVGTASPSEIALAEPGNCTLKLRNLCSSAGGRRGQSFCTLPLVSDESKNTAGNQVLLRPAASGCEGARIWRSAGTASGACRQSLTSSKPALMSLGIALPREVTRSPGFGVPSLDRRSRTPITLCKRSSWTSFSSGTFARDANWLLPSLDGLRTRQCDLMNRAVQ